MKFENVYMGSMLLPWMSDKNIKYVTFSVTDDCNLMCKYCYFTHKTTKHKMTFDVAQKAIDYILSEDKFLIHDGVVWDFIGGEPTLEMDLIEQICDYILYRMYTLKHKWLYCYRFMVGTNGLLYASEKFQAFLLKHNQNLHVNITVDGNREKHDLSRIKKDGSGSYDDIVKILPLWFRQTGNYSTKATFAHADLPYLKDSIINLWNLGFKNVMANVVFENVWEDGDDLIYENQLRQLAEYIIDNALWNKFSVRFFSPSIGFPIGDQQKRLNFCGSGNMLAIDYLGNFFPCVRFMNSALNNKEGRIIGDSTHGMMFDRLRAFNMLSYDVQSPKKCITCDISSGCNWCTGFNYDESEKDSIFERQIYHCDMHHANVRANEYFWKLYEEKTGNISPLRYNKYIAKSSNNKYLYIYNNDSINICHVKSSKMDSQAMSDEIYEKTMAFCERNHMIPIHVGFEKKKSFGYYICDMNSTFDKDEFTMDYITHDTLPAYNASLGSKLLIYSVEYDMLDLVISDIEKMTQTQRVYKISVVIVDYYKWRSEHLKKYTKLLNELSDLLVDSWSNKYYLQINIITDNMFMLHRKYCSANLHEWTVTPAGDIYACFGEYLMGGVALSNVETLKAVEELNTTHKELYTCEYCNVKQCNKCFALNKRLTCESDVPFEIHCVKNNLELECAVNTIKRIDSMGLKLPFDINRRIQGPCSLDPLIDLRGEHTYANQGFYKFARE